ncbi:hypothetical protein M436DRAFT_57300, partial [Aureobasidium namibiae CBS 147.97]
ITYGPFEIANALRASMLNRPTVANAAVKELIKKAGQREVKYEAMVQNNTCGRLAIAEPAAVRGVWPSIYDRGM